MKQTILLMVLALGMCSINVSAQTKKPVRRVTTQSNTKPKDSREYQVGDDGFEWYKVCKNGKYGVEDRNGNVLVPTEFTSVSYRTSYNSEGSFIGNMGGNESLFSKAGKCIIPYTRNYYFISKSTKDEYGTYYECLMKDGHVWCDIIGKEVFSVNGYYSRIWDYCEKGKFFFRVETRDNMFGIVDGNGRFIVEPKCNNYINLSSDGKFIFKNKDTGMDEVVGYLSSITTSNPLARNPKEGVSSTNSTASSNVDSNTNTNPGGGTTTVVVEPHLDPVPVQQWQACWACGGMGTMECDNCGGSGTKYIGDRLHICSRCNGRGIIPCNICFGNKGKYITVDR